MNLRRLSALFALAAIPAAAFAANAATPESTNIFSSGMDIRTTLENYAPAGGIRATENDYSIGEKGKGRERILEIVTKMTQLAAVLALAGIVWAGWVMVTSNGDDEKAKQGKTALVWAAGGFAIAILAGPAVNLIVNVFFGTLG